MKNNLVGLIFSKDRGMQLQATMESFLLHYGDSNEVKLRVLYKASTHLYQRQYDKLKQNFSNVSFIEETNFKEQVLATINGYEHVLFMVDDNLFARDFRLTDVLKSLHDNYDAVGFSLRLGTNTEYCYAKNTPQALPTFKSVGNGVLKYDWTRAEFDFNYPLEVSSSVYRVRDIWPLLVQLKFGHPNVLEALMASNAHLYIRAKPTLLCYETSVTFCNPINLVQMVSNNRVGSNHGYSADRLAEMFEEGFKIDVQKYSNFVSNSCHQEVELRFNKPDAAMERDRPLVSVEMVTYNTESFIRQAIDSVLAQTYQNFELLIVDDGSTDSTKQIVASYSDDRIRYIYQPHRNAASARNRAIVEAKGEYLVCVDSDDFIAADYIEKLLAFAQKYPDIDYFYPAKLVLMDESGNPTGQRWEYLDFSDNKVLPAFLFDKGYGPIPNPGSLKRRTLFDKVNLYEDVDSVEDFVFLCKNALKVNFKRVQEHSTYFYRSLASSSSHNLKARNHIMAHVLNDMVSIYPAEVLCPRIADISDHSSREQQYYEYLATTFYRHAHGHMVRYGEHFQQYGNYYKQKICRTTELDTEVCSAEGLSDEKSYLKLFEQGVEHLKAARPADALLCFDEAYQVDGGMHELQLARAVALIQLGRMDDARLACEAELATQPNHSSAKMLLKSITENANVASWLQKDRWSSADTGPPSPGHCV